MQLNQTTYLPYYPLIWAGFCPILGDVFVTFCHFIWLDTRPSGPHSHFGWDNSPKLSTCFRQCPLCHLNTCGTQDPLHMGTVLLLQVMLHINGLLKGMATEEFYQDAQGNLSRKFDLLTGQELGQMCHMKSWWMKSDSFCHWGQHPSGYDSFCL